jgi:hypothetical protein
MTSSIKRCVLFAAVLLSSLQFCSAQTQTNVTDFFAFGPPLTPVWDISGTYQITNRVQRTILQPLEIVFRDLHFDVDSHGHLQGADTIIVMVGDDPVAGDYKASGKISGGGAKTRVNLSIRCNGHGIVAGVDTSYTVSAKYNLVVDPANLTLVGKTSGNANFANLGGGKLNSAFALPLLPGVDGRWNVTLDVVPLTKLAGTGLITVDNYTAPDGTTGPATGRTLTTKVTGSVPKKSSAAKLKLSGSGSSAGTKLTLSFPVIGGPTNQVATAQGKVLGQTVRN